MTTQSNISLREGENWQIEFTAHKADGSIMPLTSGAVVNFRIEGIDGNGDSVTLIELTVGDGILITDDINGVAVIQVLKAQQQEAGLTADSLAYYEIDVVSGDEVPSIQAEGRLSIERSLFAQAIDPLLMQFQARFPEFTEDDSTISIYLREATMLLSTDTGLLTDDRPIATVYLAAHLLQLRKNASVTGSTGSVDLGAVKSISVEDRTVTFETGSVTKQAVSSKFSLGSTYYGERFLAIMRRAPRFILRA